MAGETVCREFFPGDTTREDGVLCSRCRVPMLAHPPFRGRDLQAAGRDVLYLLTHYGHHCTVQNLLPELARALARPPEDGVSRQAVAERVGRVIHADPDKDR